MFTNSLLFLNYTLVTLLSHSGVTQLTPSSKLPPDLISELAELGICLNHNELAHKRAWHLSKQIAISMVIVFLDHLRFHISSSICY